LFLLLNQSCIHIINPNQHLNFLFLFLTRTYRKVGWKLQLQYEIIMRGEKI